MEATINLEKLLDCLTALYINPQVGYEEFKEIHDYLILFNSSPKEILDRPGDYRMEFRFFCARSIVHYLKSFCVNIFKGSNSLEIPFTQEEAPEFQDMLLGLMAKNTRDGKVVDMLSEAYVDIDVYLLKAQEYFCTPTDKTIPTPFIYVLLAVSILPPACTFVDISIAIAELALDVLLALEDSGIEDAPIHVQRLILRCFSKWALVKGGLSVTDLIDSKLFSYWCFVFFSICSSENIHSSQRLSGSCADVICVVIQVMAVVESGGIFFFTKADLDSFKFTTDFLETQVYPNTLKLLEENPDRGSLTGTNLLSYCRIISVAGEEFAHVIAEASEEKNSIGRATSDILDVTLEIIARSNGSFEVVDVMHEFFSRLVEALKSSNPDFQDFLAKGYKIPSPWDEYFENTLRSLVIASSRTISTASQDNEDLDPEPDLKHFRESTLSNLFEVFTECFSKTSILRVLSEFLQELFNEEELDFRFIESTLILLTSVLTLSEADLEIYFDTEYETEMDLEMNRRKNDVLRCYNQSLEALYAMLEIVEGMNDKFQNQYFLRNTILSIVLPLVHQSATLDCGFVQTSSSESGSDVYETSDEAFLSFDVTRTLGFILTGFEFPECATVAGKAFFNVLKFNPVLLEDPYETMVMELLASSSDSRVFTRAQHWWISRGALALVQTPSNSEGDIYDLCLLAFESSKKRLISSIEQNSYDPKTVLDVLNHFRNCFTDLSGYIDAKETNIDFNQVSVQASVAQSERFASEIKACVKDYYSTELGSDVFKNLFQRYYNDTGVIKAIVGLHGALLTLLRGSFNKELAPYILSSMEFFDQTLSESILEGFQDILPLWNEGTDEKQQQYFQDKICQGVYFILYKVLDRFFFLPMWTEFKSEKEFKFSEALLDPRSYFLASRIWIYQVQFLSEFFDLFSESLSVCPELFAQLSYHTEAGEAFLESFYEGEEEKEYGKQVKNIFRSSEAKMNIQSQLLIIALAGFETTIKSVHRVVSKFLLTFSAKAYIYESLAKTLFNHIDILIVFILSKLESTDGVYHAIFLEIFYLVLESNLFKSHNDSETFLLKSISNAVYLLFKPHKHNNIAYGTSLQKDFLAKMRSAVSTHLYLSRETPQRFFFG